MLSLPHSYLEDSTSYREVANLPPPDEGRERVEAHAQRRKDLSVAGFVELRSRIEQEGPQALDEFYRSAAALTHDQLEEWRELWHNGAERAVATTGDQLRALESGDLAHLQDGALREANPRAGSPRPGMCGRITNFDPAIVQVATTKLA